MTGIWAMPSFSEGRDPVRTRRLRNESADFVHWIRHNALCRPEADRLAAVLHLSGVARTCVCRCEYQNPWVGRAYEALPIGHC
jgi:hypothetical protein